ncbi:MAG: exo-alpha-sialidase [Armatimonadetes bacterium]|nr:exo-alpha-sialidase [Armatimonadota bacterium]
MTALLAALLCWPAQDLEPQGAFLADGRIVVASGQKDTVNVAVTSGPVRPKLLSLAAPRLMLGMRRGPRIAVAGESIVVTFCGAAEKFKGDLWAVSSQDSGKTWSEPVRVNDEPGCAPEGLNGLASDARGNTITVWLDHRGPNTEIWSSWSKDGGRNWSKNSRVYASPSGNVCECCHPSVCFDGKSNAHVVWRNSLGGDRDMYVATSQTEGGWSKAEKLGEGTWPLNACPMDGGAVSSYSADVVSVWRRQKQVFACRPARSETELGEGEQPTVAVVRNAVWVAWLERRNGRLLVEKLGEKEPKVVTESANDPVLFKGSAGQVALTWQGPSGTQVLRLAN